jgi:hypothetical protein
VRGENRRRRRFALGKRFQRAKGPCRVDSARGARTFREVGHEFTLGRTSHLIVNKFSTMTQRLDDTTDRCASRERHCGARGPSPLINVPPACSHANTEIRSITEGWGAT